jgi:hypothetical protein
MNFDLIPDWGEFTTWSPDGRVPVTKVQNWEQFCEMLKGEFFNRLGAQLVFRGQRRSNWSLSPSLSRLGNPKGIITEKMAEDQLRLFRRAVRGRLRDRSLVEDGDEAQRELWAVGQHHGLMTPLLDWTYSPYVALFFAFEKQDPENEETNPYRAVYVLNKSHIEADDKCPEVQVLEPRKDDHGRLVNQAGLFTHSAYGNTLENSLIQSLQDEVLEDVTEEDEAKTLAQYFCKIYIPNKDREDCLRSLRRMNVHHASLFPDLIGASEYCNILMEEAHPTSAEEKAVTSHVSVVDQVQPRQTQVSFGTVSASNPDIETLLRAPAESAQVEPGRIPLIAQELAQEIEKNKVVDWETRDTVQARLRNVVRVVLRKYGYPASAREQIASEVLSLAQSRAKGEAGTGTA